jgi:hypothetical protein
VQDQYGALEDTHWKIRERLTSSSQNQPGSNDIEQVCSEHTAAECQPHQYGEAVTVASQRKIHCSLAPLGD